MCCHAFAHTAQLIIIKTYACIGATPAERCNYTELLRPSSLYLAEWLTAVIMRGSARRPSTVLIAGHQCTVFSGQLILLPSAGREMNSRPIGYTGYGVKTGLENGFEKT